MTAPVTPRNLPMTKAGRVTVFEMTVSAVFRSISSVTTVEAEKIAMNRPATSRFDKPISHMSLLSSLIVNITSEGVKRNIIWVARTMTIYIGCLSASVNVFLLTTNVFFIIC